MRKSNGLSEVGTERPRYIILGNSGMVGATIVVILGRRCFQEHHYAKAELCGLSASGSCSSKVQNGLASLEASVSILLIKQTVVTVILSLHSIGHLRGYTLVSSPSNRPILSTFLSIVA